MSSDFARGTLLRWVLLALLTTAGCAARGTGPGAPTPSPAGAQPASPLSPASAAAATRTWAIARPSPTAGPELSPTPAGDPPRFGAPWDLLELPPWVGIDYRVSPDGRWASYREIPGVGPSGATAPGGLVARNLETGQRVLLLDNPRIEWHAWFPDGQRVLIVAGAGDGRVGEVFAGSLGPEPALSLARAPADSLGFGEAVPSPDGRRIALAVHYYTSPAPVSSIGIDVMAPDGSGRRRVAEPDFFVGHLAWSPDGRQVVYFKGRGGTPPEAGEAYVADAEGAPAPPRLLMPGARVVAWSPDGRRALWATEPMDPEGNVDLLATGWPDLGPAKSIAERASAFGADWVGADWIVFARGGALYLAPSSEGGGVRRLTPEGGGAETPVWLPGRGIVYRSPSGAGTVLRLLPTR